MVSKVDLAQMELANFIEVEGGDMDQVLDLLMKIAKNDLDIETLESRNHDSYDFQEVAVWSVKTALMRAYALGKSDMTAGEIGQLTSWI